MGAPQSQKRGSKSTAQKEEKARDGYEPVPSSNPVRGAFGGTKENASEKPSQSEPRHRHRVKPDNVDKDA